LGFISDGTNVTAGSGNLRAIRPQIATSLDDSNGNEVATITATASAVNQFGWTNGATGNGPVLSAVGDDTNIPLTFSPKGTGQNIFTKDLLMNVGAGSLDNLIYVASTSSGAVNASFGFFVAGFGSTQSSDGPYFLGRGLNFSAIGNQRGLMYFAAGAPGTPVGNDGCFLFNTGNPETVRIRIPISGDVAQFAVGGSFTAGTYTGVASGGTLFTPRNVVTGTGTINLDFALGNIQQCTFGAGNATFTFSNIPNSAHITIVIIQDGTGGRTLTWPGTAKFIGGVAPTLSAGANARDIINFYSDGTNIYQTSAIALAVA
jgi:hypothetical protein